MSQNIIGKKPRKKRLRLAFMAAVASLGLVTGLESLPKNSSSDTQSMTSFSHDDGTMRGYNISPKDQLWKQTLTMRSQQELDAALLVAVAQGDSWRVRSLYEHTDFNKSVSRDALETAVAEWHVDVIRAILDHDKKAGYESNVLAIAIRMNADALVRLLVEQKALDQPAMAAGLSTAVAQKDLYNLTYLLKNGADPKTYNSESLFIAIATGNIDTARILLNHGADINAGNGRSLTKASENGDLRMIDFILAQGYTTRVPVHPPVDVWDYEGNIAWQNGDRMNSTRYHNRYRDGSNDDLYPHDELRTQTIYVRSVNLDNNNGAALMAAIRHKHDAATQKLIDAGASVNIGNGAPLTLAASLGDLPMVEKLLEAGADAKRNNSAALLTAARLGHEEICKTLIKHGANPLAQDGAIIAAGNQSQNPDIMMILLDGQFPAAEKNLLPRQGLTP